MRLRRIFNQILADLTKNTLKLAALTYLALNSSSSNLLLLKGQRSTNLT